MKNKILLLLTLISNTLFAGYGYHYISDINVYDIDTGLYYKSIEKKVKKSGFTIIKSIGSGSRTYSNINIYNPKTKKSVMIFKTDNQNITDLLFEMKYDKNTIIYFSTGNYIKNDKYIEKRELKDKLLISTYDKEKKETTLWSCNKNGKNLKKLTIIKKGYKWHIDVKNSKIVLVFAKDGKFKIESYDW